LADPRFSRAFRAANAVLGSPNTLNNFVKYLPLRTVLIQLAFDATAAFSHADVGICRGHPALQFQNSLTSSKKEL